MGIDEFLYFWKWLAWSESQTAYSGFELELLILFPSLAIVTISSFLTVNICLNNALNYDFDTRTSTLSKKEEVERQTHIHR